MITSREDNFCGNMSGEFIEGEKLIFAAVGDMQIERRLSVFDEERFLALFKVLKDADVALGHFEMNMPPQNSPQYSSGFVVRAEPWVVDELKWAGFDLLSIAHNHSGDFGAPGVLCAKEHLEKAGIITAGAGRNLAEARAPGYLDTRVGRVALISACSTFAPWLRAGEARPDHVGGPGINGFRFSTRFIVNFKTFKEMRKIAQELGLIFRNDEEFSLPLPLFRGEVQFAVGDKSGVEMTANKSDFEANIKSVKEAKGNADWAFVSFHSHEAKGRVNGTLIKDDEHNKSAEFVASFAHSCIDAGADGFVGHGSHNLRGIELYKGKPIFHSLGNFIATLMTLPTIGYDTYEAMGLDPLYGSILDVWVHKATVGLLGDVSKREHYYFETVVPVVTFEGGSLSDLKLYPVHLDPYGGLVRWREGRPWLAAGKQAEEIIRHLSNLSSPYGTEIEFDEEKGIGEVKF